MNRSRLVLACAGISVLLGAATASYAQNPDPGAGRTARQGQRGQRGQVSAASLPVDVVDKIVKLTPEQKTKLGAIHDKYTADMKALPAPQPGQPVDQETRQKRSEINTSARTQIEALLTDEQKKRLADGLRDLGALRAAGVPVELVADLKLTDDQKKQIAGIQKDVQAKRQALTPEERRTKGRELNQEARTKIEAVLTADQKAQIERYRKDHPRRNGNRP